MSAVAKIINLFLICKFICFCIKFLYFCKNIIMKIIYNKILPFRGFYAMYFIKWVFVREEYKHHDNSIMINHESIHEQQLLDFTPSIFPNFLRYLIGTIFFYSSYVIEWLIRLLINKDAYRSICYEQEAYANERNLDYLKSRKRFAWLFKKWKLK